MRRATFFHPYKKSLTFRISGLLFGACCFFGMWWCGILFGAGYFFEARLDSVVRTTFWAGQEYFFAKAESVLKPQMVKNLVKTKPYPNRTESVRVQKAYQTQHDGEKKAYSFFAFYPYSTRTNPYRNTFFGPVGLSIWISGVIRGILFRTRRVFQGCFADYFFPTPRNSIPERRNGKKYPFALTGRGLGV